ncbi:MAG: polyprenol monophosphomannose synthase [Candidatus Bathyarchaeota archaeon]|nr:polyprenol monophosphomannose synthase [Candidatus Bathyarchaeota archaeon]
MSQITIPSKSDKPSSPSYSTGVVADKKPSVAIILPTYCEAGNIGNLIREIKDLMQDSLILVIDDSSNDGTASIVESLQTEYSNILCFKRPSKLGLGTAITDGFNVVLSLRNPPDYIITMDADYSHNPQALPKLLDSARRGYDLVIGSRYITDGRIVGWHAMRRLISRVANFLASTMVAMKIRDCTSGYRCYSRRYIQNVISYLHSQTYEIQIETVKQAWMKNFQIKEIPITFENRKKGKSKLTKTEFQGFMFYIAKTKLAPITQCKSNPIW